MKITPTFAVGIAALGLMLLPIMGTVVNDPAPQTTPTPVEEITDYPVLDPTDEPSDLPTEVLIVPTEEPPVDEPLPTDEPTDEASLTCDETGNFCGSIG